MDDNHGCHPVECVNSCVQKKNVLKVHNTAEHLLMDGYVYDTGAPAALKGIINKV